MIWTDISQKKTYKWSIGVIKILTINNHKGNAIQNHNEMSLQHNRNGYYQKDKKNAGENVENGELIQEWVRM
jgi:hypothetical protein